MALVRIVLGHLLEKSLKANAIEMGKLLEKALTLERLN
jgi:hypothetical protein